MHFPIAILVGTEFGTSADVAKRLARELTRFRFRPTIHKMDEFPIEALPTTKYAIFLCSTTGQGQPPGNMTQFWNFLLRSDLPPTVLSNLNYAVFGLGDSSYPLYNAVARRLDKRLAALGGRQFCDIGLGDDQHSMGYDGGFIPWLLDLYTALLSDCMDFFDDESQDIQLALRNAILAEESSLVDDAAPTMASTEMTDSATDAESGNISGMPKLGKTDYLAFSSVDLRVIKAANFDRDVVDELMQSPAAREILYHAVVSTLAYSTYTPAPSQVPTQFTKAQIDQLINAPTDAQIDRIIELVLSYIGPEISPESVANYHQLPIPNLFTNELLFEVLYPTLPQTTPSTTQNPNKVHFSSSYKPLPILSTLPLTASNHFQSVNHITYDLAPLVLDQSSQSQSTTPSPPNPNTTPQSPLTTFSNLVQNPPYLPGDVLEVVPPTPNPLVNALLTLYNLSPNDIIITARQPQHLSQASSSSSLPTYTPITFLDSFDEYLMDLMELQSTLTDDFETQLTNSSATQSKLDKTTPPPTRPFAMQRYDTFPLFIRAWQLFTWYIQTAFTPQRHHFFMLAQQAQKPEEKERLSDLCTASYASTLDSYCIRERRTIVEVFTDFPTALLPLGWLVELCDRIKPRQFSIASSPLYNFIPLSNDNSNTALPPSTASSAHRPQLISSVDSTQTNTLHPHPHHTPIPPPHSPLRPSLLHHSHHPPSHPLHILILTQPLQDRQNDKPHNCTPQPHSFHLSRHSGLQHPIQARQIWPLQLIPSPLC